jgi:phospholipid/cholesterol/gamma-HCH transport system substrate-binding protein
METRANFVLIGAFSLAVIVGAFMLVLFFSGLGRVSETKVYQVVFTGSVSGLLRGGPVLFNGLRVGEVTQIDFVPNDPGRVSAFIKVEARIPIKTDTKARLELQGLTGGSAVALSGESSDAPALQGKDGAPAVIVAEPSQFQNLLQNVQSISQKADAVLGKADKLIEANSGAITDTLHNIDAFSKALGEHSAGLGDAMGGLAEVGRKIGPLADRLQKLSDDTDKLIVAVDPAKVRRAVEDLGAFTGALGDPKGPTQSALKDVATLAKRLDDTSVQLGSAVSGIDALVKAVDTKKVASFIDGADQLGRKIGPLADRLQKLGDDSDKLIVAIDPTKVKRVVEDVAAFTGVLGDPKGSAQMLLSDAATLAKRLTDSSTYLTSALQDIDSLVKSFDTHKVAELMDGVGGFGETLKENKGNIDHMLKNASELTAKLDSAADKVDGVLTSAQSFLGSSATKGPLGEVGDAAKSVRKLADDLNVRTKDIAAGLTRFSGSGLREYEALAVDGRKTVNDLDRFIKGFEKNPSQLIFGAKPALPEYNGGN